MSRFRKISRSQSVEIIKEGNLIYVSEKKNSSIHLWHRLRHNGHTCQLHNRTAILFKFPNGKIVFKCYKKYKATHSIDLSLVVSIKSVGQASFEITTSIESHLFEAATSAERNRWVKTFQSLEDDKCFSFSPFYKLDEHLVQIAEQQNNRKYEKIFAKNEKLRNFSEKDSDDLRRNALEKIWSRRRYDTFETTQSRSERNSDGGCSSFGTSECSASWAVNELCSPFASSSSVVFTNPNESEVPDLLVVSQIKITYFTGMAKISRAQTLR